MALMIPFLSTDYPTFFNLRSLLTNNFELIG